MKTGSFPGSIIPLGPPSMFPNVELDEMWRDMMRRGLVNGPPPSIIPKPPAFSIQDNNPMQMICMRLRLKHGEAYPLPHMSAYVTSKVAVVFGVDKNDKPFFIEDDVDLFPSDTLITQLRLIIG